tara:strand:- start:1244 stop:2329 length:1086 start_codon:yes stop_codon:yes gene_type:complete
MKNFKLIILLIFISNVFSQEISNKYAETITSEELKSLIYVYASDSFEGREAGTRGEILAVEFIRDFYLKNEIKPANGTDNYFQKMEVTIPERISLPDKVPDSVRVFMQNGEMEKLRNYARIAGVRTGGGKINSINVASIIEGSLYPNEYIVLTAHLDHVGMEGEEIFNGADDDGSGSMALLEIAQAFKMAAVDGNRPKRSIVILHVSAEEKGLLGSEYYTENPLYPLEDTITNLNVDMIGRTDPTRDSDNDDYIYLIGTDRLSSMLHETSERVNKKTVNLELDYRFNAWDDPNRFYFRSDHYNFAKNNIPVIFYFSGTHEDYHMPTDTADKIRYDLLTKRTKLIFHTAWEIANMEEKIIVD